jgi:hypothetical protein
MYISEKGAKVVFVSLVCISLGALLGLEVKSQTHIVEDINFSVNDDQQKLDTSQVSEDIPKR